MTAVLAVLIILGFAGLMIDTFMIGFKEFGFKGLFRYPDDDE